MPRRGSGTEQSTQRRNKSNPIQEGDATDSWGRRRKAVKTTMTKRPVDPETGKADLTDPGVEVELFVPPEEFRCRARALSGPYQGQRCRNFSIRGGPVCFRHGGNLPNVRKAAQLKLLMAANPAIEKLIDIALHKKGVDDNDRLRAIAQILDRAGIVGKQEVAVEIKPWQEAIRKLMGSEEEKPAADVDLVEGQDFWVDYDHNQAGDDEGGSPTPPARRQPSYWDGGDEL